jgi:hypothetical protein
MRIFLTDGSILECSTIQIQDNQLYLDDYRILDIEEVDTIEDDV